MRTKVKQGVKVMGVVEVVVGDVGAERENIKLAAVIASSLYLRANQLNANSLTFDQCTDVAKGIISDLDVIGYAIGEYK